MRLTKFDRETFVKWVMQDVPKIDYYNQLRSAVQEAIIAAAPTAVQRCYQTHRDFLQSRSVNVFHNLYNEDFYGLVERIYKEEQFIAVVGATVFAELKAIDDAWTAQNTLRNELQNKLEGAVIAYTTRKQLAAALPEFEKYLPPEEAKGSNLPALANVVTDFIAAGWPAGKANAAADVVT